MLHIRLRHFIPEAAIIGEVTGIGIPSFLQLSGQSAALIIVNQFLRKYGGDLAISSYGIANRIIVFFLFPIQGISQGLQPVIGYNKGAGKPCQKSAVYCVCNVGILRNCRVSADRSDVRYIYETVYFRPGSYRNGKSYPCDREYSSALYRNTEYADYLFPGCGEKDHVAGPGAMRAASLLCACSFCAEQAIWAGRCLVCISGICRGCSDYLQCFIEN